MGNRGTKVRVPTEEEKKAALHSWWRYELLWGIDQLPALTCSKILVFGQNAFAILTGSGCSDVIMAAATYGKGRIVVFSHDHFTKCFQEYVNNNGVTEKPYQVLCKNVLNWLNQDGKAVDLSKVVDFSKGMKVSKETKVGIWHIYPPTGDSVEEEVTKFVENGGGVVTAMTPWGYLQMHPTTELKDVPIHQFIQKAGLIFLPSPMASQRFFVQNNEAKDSHAGQALEALVSDRPIDEGELLLLNEETLDAMVNSSTIQKLDLFEFYIKYKNKIPHFPTYFSPVVDERQKVMMNICEYVYTKMGSRLPATIFFPGYVIDPSPESVVLEIVAPKGDIYSTGYWALPHEPVALEILSEPNETWFLRIGCHTDCNRNEPKLFRWPCIHRKAFIGGQKRISLTNPFGGLVYLQCRQFNGKQESIKFKLSNVVKAPYIDITDPKSIQDWEERKKAPGLWGDLCGEFITLTLPKATFREIPDIVKVLKKWDDVVKACHHLIGSNIREGRRQWLVYDRFSKSVHHAGHPVVMNRVWSFMLRCQNIIDTALNIDHLNQGSKDDEGLWGEFHEIGHNLQDWTWTFEGATDKTNNILALYVMDVVSGVKPVFDQGWQIGIVGKAKHYFEDCPNYEKWKADDHFGLAVFTQLINAFGWGAYKQFFRQCNDLTPEEKPKNDQDKIDLWISGFSSVVKMNLVPMFELYCFPISDWVREKLDGLPCFLPEDDVTANAGKIYECIKKKYADKLQKSTQKVPDTFTFDIPKPLVEQPYVRVTN